MAASKKVGTIEHLTGRVQNLILDDDSPLGSMFGRKLTVLSVSVVQTTFICTDLAGKFANDFFNGMFVKVYKATNLTVGTVARISDYVGATGQFVVEAMGATIVAGDKMLLLSPAQAGRCEFAGSVLYAPRGLDTAANVGVTLTEGAANTLGAAGTLIGGANNVIPEGGCKIVGMVLLAQSAATLAEVVIFYGTTVVAAVYCMALGYYGIDSDMVIPAGATVTAKTRTAAGAAVTSTIKLVYKTATRAVQA